MSEAAWTLTPIWQFPTLPNGAGILPDHSGRGQTVLGETGVVQVAAAPDVAPDLVGGSDEIAERLVSLASFREIDEVAFALPFTFAPDDYEQILTDIATRLTTALGWRPSS